MFVQIIKGHTDDRAGLRRQLERWRTDLKPGAIGFLGSTVGIADDGTFVVLARFADADSAKKNSDRSEQGAWWEETAKFFDDEPTFRESTDVSTLFDGGSDRAGFVQVMEGTVEDRAKAEAFETPELLDRLRAARPDLLGAIRAWLPDGAYVEVAYFASEADARTGESSSEFGDAEAAYSSHYRVENFIDLREPLFD